MDFEMFSDMDTTTFIITVLLSVAITAFAYLLVPGILVIRKKKYKLSTIKKIALIDGVVCVVIFSALKGEPATGGFILWTAVAYWLLKKKCVIEQVSQPTPPQTSYSLSPDGDKVTRFKRNKIYGSDIALQKDEHQEMPPQPVTKSVVEQAVPTKKEKKPTPTKRMAVYHVCLLLLVCFLAVTNAIQYNRAINYAEHIQMQQETYNTLSENYEKLSEGYEKMKANNLDLTQELHKYKYQNREKLNFMDEHVVFIEDDNTNLYHKYDCSRFKGNYFWAFNTEYAEARGYSPCPYCH